jgi:hypothetical protein
MAYTQGEAANSGIDLPREHPVLMQTVFLPANRLCGFGSLNQAVSAHAPRRPDETRIVHIAPGHRASNIMQAIALPWVRLRSCGVTRSTPGYEQTFRIASSRPPTARCHANPALLVFRRGAG